MWLTLVHLYMTNCNCFIYLTHDLIINKLLSNSGAILIALVLEVINAIFEPCLFGSLVGSTVFHHMAPQITCLFGWELTPFALYLRHVYLAAYLALVWRWGAIGHDMREPGECHPRYNASNITAAAPYLGWSGEVYRDNCSQGMKMLMTKHFFNDA